MLLPDIYITKTVRYWQGLYKNKSRGVEMIIYKVVETSQVEDLSLEKIINDWTAQGWNFDQMQFAMRDGNRRPAMAFLIFTREED